MLRIKPGEAAKDTLSRREENSVTAEFAPHARLGKPPFTWEQSAIDALQFDGLTTVTTWTLPIILFKLEASTALVIAFDTRGLNHNSNEA